jgi:DnaJ-class molecular chaperone
MAEPTCPVDGCTLYLRYLYGRPNLVWSSSAWLGFEGFKGFKVEVCDELPAFKSGKRKGQLNYAKAGWSATKYFLKSDMDAYVSVWAEENNKCISCLGEGRKWLGWSKDEGNQYKVCPECNGTGNYKNA